MWSLDTLDIVLLAAAAYLAVTGLVRLMRHRREGLINQLTQQVEAEAQRLREQRRRERRKEKDRHKAEQRARGQQRKSV